MNRTEEQARLTVIALLSAPRPEVWTWRVAVVDALRDYGFVLAPPPDKVFIAVDAEDARALQAGILALDRRHGDTPPFGGSN